ncbi:sigma-70 family RNA polymerase sigma factor [Anaerotignum sp. MB30-C6]|uniref:sigma-70 family RNA polymerase sigma factor n=1 Tax=Anaerotignum sp. MB30-C6 TaxID=3070814 RepID=UPI0027DACF62|nr:FliA/WhiG family RNA polymerase sigma factor [Anaerotignum sp. MB30-C6]WMI80968.1 FliA/WhiG family RNA polymerase sigma factor [Anaerotignum sp. MB30-C6]
MILKKKLSEMTNEELFAEYKVSGDLEIKNELVLRYIHIVKAVAIQMRGVYSDFTQVEDIVNEGVLALMNSIDKFDLDMNVKFESYISKRVRGVVIDIARKNDWVPRSVRKAAKDIDNATNELFIQLGRMPTDEEMANHLNITVQKYLDDLAKTNVMNVLSFEMLLEEVGNGRVNNQVMSTNRESMPEYHLDNLELEREIKKGLESLREREQLVVSLHYVQDLNMKEIAAVLGVSEPRISQIHSNALRKLRLFLQE